MKWAGVREPWENQHVGIQTPDASGTASFPALWERAVDGQLPSPGYGPVPSTDELELAFIDKGFLVTGFQSMSARQLIDALDKLQTGPAQQDMTLADISVLLGV